MSCTPSSINPTPISRCNHFYSTYKYKYDKKNGNTLLVTQNSNAIDMFPAVCQICLSLETTLRNVRHISFVKWAWDQGQNLDRKNMQLKIRQYYDQNLAYNYKWCHFFGVISFDIFPLLYDHQHFHLMGTYFTSASPWRQLDLNKLPWELSD